MEKQNERHKMRQTRKVASEITIVIIKIRKYLGGAEP